MRLDKTTLLLFSPFFREVSKKRLVVRNVREFADYVERANGVEDVFTSVYPLDYTIDKIFLDFDGHTSIIDAGKVYEYLTENGYTVIPVASGKKGIHLYVLVKPVKFPDLIKAKETLTRATYYILNEVFGNGSKIAVASIDTHLIGNVRGLCRVPNTLRPPENRSYCTYLPPDFASFTWQELVLHAKKVHVYEYEIKKLLDISTLASKFDINHSYHEKVVGEQIRVKPTRVHEFLKRVLRPCLYNKIIGKNPRHQVRVAATVDLLQSGFSPETIFNIYKQLGWEDFNPEITRYQINSCKHLLPYSCKKLRQLGIPEVCCIR